MLEGLYSAELIKKKPYIALLMGFTYSIIGIGLASWLFRKDPAIVSVALTSLLLYPSIKSLIRIVGIFNTEISPPWARIVAFNTNSTA